MHVGMAAVFQNTGRALSDHQVYLNELALADMAEPLGFDSVWSVEHHFTDYTMCPDVLQFLSYMAGRTRHVRLGSMVVVRIMATLGVGLLIIPQKPWREVEKELGEYNRLYREINGTDAPQPISAGWTFVDESAERARELAIKYIGGYYRTVLEHYQFAGEHMKNQRGYEYYAKMNEKLAVYGDEKAIEFFVNLQVFGTPEQVYDKIMAIHRQTNNSAYVGVFSFAGMPHEEAARNMRMFAATVMPELRKFEAGAAIDRSTPLPDLRFAVAAE